MNVIRKRELVKVSADKGKDVKKELEIWYTIAKKAKWENFGDVQKRFKDADLVGELLVFNIRHNRFRLIVLPVFKHKKLYIKALLTHAEYDKGDWKKKWP